METYLQFREKILDKDWYIETEYITHSLHRNSEFFKEKSDIIQLDNRSFIIGGNYGYKNEFYNTFYEIDGDDFIYIAAGVGLVGLTLKLYLDAHPNIKNNLLEFYDKNKDPYGSTKMFLL